MMSTVPSVRPWLMSDSLPSEEAGNTCTSYLPLVRFLISSPAHTDHLWNGSEVSYTCAHLSLVCACAAPNGAAAAARMALAAMSFRVRRLSMKSPGGWLVMVGRDGWRGASSR